MPVAPAQPGFGFQPPTAAVAIDPASPSTVEFTARPVLQVRGADLSGGPVHLEVMHAGEVVADAQVKINGQVIPFQADRYSGELTVAVPAGGSLSLVVTRGEATVTGTGLVPEAPVLTAPATGEYLSLDQGLVVTWTSSTSPDSFAVSARWSCGPSCGTGATFEVPGSARSLTIPAGKLPVGPIDLTVLAYNDGVLAGDYEPAETQAGMNIRSESQTVSVAVGDAPGRQVSGTVSGASGEVLLDLVCSGMSPQTTATSQGGGYVFDAVPRTSCTLTPAADGYAFDPPRITLPAGLEDRTGVSFVARPLLQVRGTAIGLEVAHIEVRHAGNLVDDAVVHLDGQVVPFLSTTGTYFVRWATPLSTGEVVSLAVERGGASVVGSGVVPEAPVLITPATGARLPAGQDVVVRWTSATSPEGFLVSVLWSCGEGCGTGRSFQAPGSARDLTLPAALLPAGQLEILVGAINDGSLRGDYDPTTVDVALGPGMNIEVNSDRAAVSR